jgi:DNA polymerase III subunit gamma/tau
MTEYVPLANKLRPTTFTDFIYNKPAVVVLQSMLENNTLPNGLLLSGVRGIGKTSLARLFSRAVNCTERLPDGNPCGICDNCKMSLEDKHPDIVEMSGATHGNIDDIRAIIENATYTPLTGKYKVYIVDECQGLGKSQSSWDALLKVLEEPPPHLLWIFCTTQRNKIPDAIKSRLVSLELRMIPTEMLSDYVMSVLINQDISASDATLVSTIIARAAGNSIRDALTLVEKVIPYCNKMGWGICQVNDAIGIIDTQASLELLTHIANHDATKFWSSLSVLIDKGTEMDLIYNILIESLNNMSLVALGVDIISSNYYKELQDNIPIPRLIYIADILAKKHETFLGVPNKKFFLQMLALEICL